MARKKAVTTDVIENEVPSITSWDQVRNTANVASEHSQQVMTAYGEGLPYDRSRVVHEARFYMATSAEAMLEAGKRLVILKEHEPHGEFETIVREQIGLPERTAQRMMQSAIKYLSPTLQSKAPALAVLGKTKLFELMTEDDDSLAELAEGGTIAGMNLDEIDRMSSRELRQALRKARDQQQDQERVISDKDKKINEQSKLINRIKRMPVDEDIKQMRSEISAIQNDIEQQIRTNMHNALDMLEAFGESQHEFIKSQIKMLDDAVKFLRSAFAGAGTEWEEQE
jgi:hypothetical protein